jgi:ATP-binding cassette subfamily C protein
MSDSTTKNIEELSLFRKMLMLFETTDRRWLLLMLASMILSAGFEALGVGLIMPLLAAISAPEKLAEYQLYQWWADTYGVPERENVLLVTCGMLLLVYIVKNSYLLGHKYFSYAFIFDRQVRFSNRLLRSYMNQDYEFHLQRNSSTLLRTINEEVRLAFTSVLAPMMNVMVEMLVALAIIGLLLVVEPLVSIITFTVFALIAGIFLKYARRKAHQYGKAQQLHAREMIKWVQQGLGGIKEIKVLRREPYFIDHYTESSRGFADAIRAHRVMTEVPRALIETVGIGVMLLLTALMLGKGEDAGAVLPVLGLFGLAAVRMMPSMNRTVTLLAIARGYVHALDGVLEHLEDAHSPNAMNDQAAKEVREPFTEPLVLSDLKFSYTEGEPVLNGLSLEIAPGEVIGFVGSSGAGKSTLVNIILGLLQPSSGTLMLGDKSLAEVLPSWQRNCGYISQPTYLCDDTIRRNIALGVPDDEISDEQVWKVLEMAVLNEFIASLPEGLDTFVGEQGVRLSGGQRQRIGIARALYHNPDILVLDEATSSLDNRTEREISDAIHALGQDKTILIIAHRLSTVRHCNRIFYLADGQVEAEGTYEELVENNEKFRDLVTAWERPEEVTEQVDDISV